VKRRAIRSSASKRCTARSTTTLTGDGADNIFYGWLGNDTLSAGGGVDQLIGGVGSDQYTGGDGNDAFVVILADMAAGVFDTITDFSFTAGNTDTLYLGGFAAGTYQQRQSGANVLISHTSLNFSGGIIVQNTTLAQLNGHVFTV
jgi:Ca2+-binding RTX toxin-like protein